MNKYFRDIPFITILIITLFLLGIFHIIGYWSTFRINPTPYLNLWDIPKIFVYPFIMSGMLSLIISLLSISAFMLPFVMKIDTDPKFIEKQYSEVKALEKYQFIPTVLLLVFCFLVFSFPKSESLWFLLFVLLAFFFFFNFYEIPFFSKVKKLSHSIILMITFFAIPAMAFLSAKLESIMIYKGKAYETLVPYDTSQHNINYFIPEKNKVLGIFSEKVLITDSLNKSLYVLNEDIFKHYKIQKNLGNK